MSSKVEFILNTFPLQTCIIVIRNIQTKLPGEKTDTADTEELPKKKNWLRIQLPHVKLLHQNSNLSVI